MLLDHGWSHLEKLALVASALGRLLLALAEWQGESVAAPKLPLTRLETSPNLDLAVWG